MARPAGAAPDSSQLELFYNELYVSLTQRMHKARRRRHLRLCHRRRHRHRHHHHRHHHQHLHHLRHHHLHLSRDPPSLYCTGPQRHLLPANRASDRAVGPRRRRRRHRRRRAPEGSRRRERGHPQVQRSGAVPSRARGVGRARPPSLDGLRLLPHAHEQRPQSRRVLPGGRRPQRGRLRRGPTPRPRPGLPRQPRGRRAFPQVCSRDEDLVDLVVAPRRHPLRIDGTRYASGRASDAGRLTRSRSPTPLTPLLLLPLQAATRGSRRSTPPPSRRPVATARPPSAAATSPSRRSCSR